MIEIIPSVFVLGGKNARLVSNSYDTVRYYDKSPLEIAIELEDHGLHRLHLIDLDGAKQGKPVNLQVMRQIKGYTKLEIEYGGGLNLDEDVRSAIEHGAKRIFAATVAVHDKPLFYSWLVSYGPDKVVLSADVINEQIAVKGRQSNTNIDVYDFIEHYIERGVRLLKCTDVQQSEHGHTPGFTLYEKILKRFPQLKILASGGVQSTDDIKKLEDIGVSGVIFGKALMEGKIQLKELEVFV